MSLVNKLNTGLAEFKDSLTIVDTDNGETLRYGASMEDGGGYLFNQKDTIDLTDLYYNSKYKGGKIDKDGQRKLFMNVVKFKANVAEKQTDLDVKNYTFIPDDESVVDLVWFLKRQFIVWTREHEFGQIINDLNKDFSKYGSCVLKTIEDGVERVPLRNLYNTQDATSLKQAPEDGGFVAIRHDMTLAQMKQMPDWDTDGLEFEGTTPVYELYVMSDPEDYDETGEEDILGVSYIANEQDLEDSVLFSEAIDEVPLEEAHWDKMDGRWLGVGEVENQFENQVAVNMTENLRRKHLIWGAKKVWQTKGNAVVKNLVRQVQDGAVLEVGANGDISEVPMASQNLQEFELSKNAWMENSDQKAFAFEVSTGEALPSGTPFRLGVILANSAARYFELKRENFGMFLHRSFFNQLIPIFKNQTKEHTVSIANGEEGTEFVRDAIINWNVNRKFNTQLLNGKIPNAEAIRAEVETDIKQSPFMFVNIPKKAYDKVNFYMKLDITQQESDPAAEMATLTTLFQVLSQKQDPRADDILDMIIGLTGNNPNKILGDTKAVTNQVQSQVQGTTPDLSGLTQLNQNNVETQ